MSMGKILGMPTAENALPGREEAIEPPSAHGVLGGAMQGPFREGVEQAMFGMGCFWGAERVFWRNHTVISTAVGYGAGQTRNPTYNEVCTGMTGHNEVVSIWFDPSECSYGELLKTFWEKHDPTQGMRQGNDVGTQYRSGIYTFTKSQQTIALRSKASFGSRLMEAGKGEITTEVLPDPVFYYAEDYHQQYLHKNPNGYCGLGGTGVSCPIDGLLVE